MSNHLTQHSIVRGIHTTVKGRARYKVNKLYRSQSLKKYLELRLSQKEGILQVRANPWTGNVLVIFKPDLSSDVLASILKDLVLDYTQQTNKPLKTIASTQTALNHELELVASNRPGVKTMEAFTQGNIVSNGLSNGYRKLEIIEGGNGQEPLTSNGHPQQSSILLMKMLLNNHLEQASKEVMLVWGAVGTLAVATGLLHYYGLDEVILLLIQRWHTPLLDRIMVGVTFLGEPATLLLICLALIMSPIGSQRTEKATTLGIATLGAVGLNFWLKVKFGRVRPALWERLVNVHHYSFPSGHAMMSIVTYGVIGYLLAKQFPQWRGRILALSFALILGIGFSRLYLGVHWPTDVLAGYGVGLVWLSACILGLELWQAYQKESNGKLFINLLPASQKSPLLRGI